MLKIGVILGSVREGRNGLAVANWTTEKVKEFSNAEEVSVELVDLADYNLPFLGVHLRMNKQLQSMHGLKKLHHSMAMYLLQLNITTELLVLSKTH